MVEEATADYPQVKKLTQIERGRIALEFIKMNENPDNYIMLNRYLEKLPELVAEYTSSEEDIVEREHSNLKYRKVQMGSKKDLQRSGILPKDGSTESPSIRGRDSNFLTVKRGLDSPMLSNSSSHRKLSKFDMARSQSHAQLSKSPSNSSRSRSLSGLAKNSYMKTKEFRLKREVSMNIRNKAAYDIIDT